MKPVWQKIIWINRKTNKVTVMNKSGRKYIIDVIPELVQDIQQRVIIIGDLAKVTKSAVSGEWVMIDYKIDPAMYPDLEEDCSCQVSLDCFDEEPDYIFNQEAEYL